MTIDIYHLLLRQKSKVSLTTLSQIDSDAGTYGTSALVPNLKMTSSCHFLNGFHQQSVHAIGCSGSTL